MSADGEDAAELEVWEGFFFGDPLAVLPINTIACAKYTDVGSRNSVAVLGF